MVDISFGRSTGKCSRIENPYSISMYVLCREVSLIRRYLLRFERALEMLLIVRERERDIHCIYLCASRVAALQG